MSASLTLISLGFTFWTLNMGDFTVSGTADGDFDYDALPGTQHEFKVQVNAGKEECFAQKVALGAVFHVQYEVCICSHFAVVSLVDLKCPENCFILVGVAWWGSRYRCGCY